MMYVQFQSYQGKLKCNVNNTVVARPNNFTIYTGNGTWFYSVLELSAKGVCPFYCITSL